MASQLKKGKSAFNPVKNMTAVIPGTLPAKKCSCFYHGPVKNRR
jgi:hypothetical protein